MLTGKLANNLISKMVEQGWEISGKALRCQFVKCPLLLYQYIKKIIYGLLLPVPFRGTDLLMVLVGPQRI